MSGETKSPEVMRAWETHSDPAATWTTPVDCDGCGKNLEKDTPVIYVSEMWVICLPCVQWATPQLEDLENQP